MGVIIDQSPPPPRNWNAKRLCIPKPVDESFDSDTTSCVTDTTTYILITKRKCRDELTYQSFHSHDTTSRTAQITCSACFGIEYIPLDFYFKNPFNTTCNLCGSRIITVEYIEYERAQPNITVPKHDVPKAFIWAHHTCYHYDTTSWIGDTTSCRVFR